MTLWQVDLHRPPLIDSQGRPLWEILICSQDLKFSYGAQAAQTEVDKAWVIEQLNTAIARAGVTPDRMQVFRPQALSLLTAAAASLGIAVEPTRRTPTLQRWLAQRAQWYPTLDHYTGTPYQPLQIEQPPPQPMPEHLWGERWRFAALSAGDFEQTLAYEPIPVRYLPAELMPSQLGLASSTPIPGLVIDAGRPAMALCQWLQTVQPAGLRYLSGPPDGLILEAGLCDRWVITTFTDAEVAEAGQLFEQRKSQSQGLHFLLIRPDDSGMTYTGLWLLQMA
ncbi:MAG TPA: DUF1092 family protein [Leptolyngbyaceae cyanobacterium M65_K2018_010]|nr:DUF1092 family protein [Leptolyngbyaceae cyanobacterium M65_K2018_010]